MKLSIRWKATLKPATIVAFGIASLLSVCALHAENNSSYVFNAVTTNIVDNGFVANVFVVGHTGTNNSMHVTNGAVVSATGSSGLWIGNQGSASNNFMTVSDPGTMLSIVGSFYVGVSGPRTRLVVSNGAYVLNTSFTRFGGGSAHNDVVVTGPGTVFTNTSGYRIGDTAIARSNTVILSDGAQMVGPSMTVGISGSDNQLFVTNGGKLILSSGFAVGSNFVTNNVAQITGPGSLVSVSTVTVGSNAMFSYAVNSRLLISDGGTLETGTIRMGYDGKGTITNIGGIFQFTTANPGIVNPTPGSLVLSNGTISFRGIANAPVVVSGTSLTNITYQGNNTFRLVGGNNLYVSEYTFDSIANTSNPTNYQRLSLTNGALFRGDHVTIGSGGAVDGTTGDEIRITRNFIIHTTNESVFDLSGSTVTFTGPASHTNAITGVDRGTNVFVADFSYGKLRLGTASDNIYFTSGDGATSNALYVHTLDLLGSTSNVARLHAPTSINIYYLLSEHNAANAYLMDKSYQLDGGGWLLPVVPEPSAMTLCVLLAGGLLARKRTIK